MAKYIDADDLIKVVEGNRFLTESVKTYVRCTVKTVHAADVAPVRHGRWGNERMKHLVTGENRKVRICSECTAGYFHYEGYDEVPSYCPNCGAKMER